eukprot:XP_015129768.2 transmembrane protein 107 isoform X3 [Gallus gallus]
MAPLGMLVPARFLTMTAHLVALLTVAMARDPHVRATLPLQFSQEEYTNADAHHSEPRCCHPHAGPGPIGAMGPQRLHLHLTLCSVPPAAIEVLLMGITLGRRRKLL